ncbi:3' terminal RNA ribose 2'-O-methyltransferase Hen1 [Nocardiopsis sp. MG754419]|uniref:3' terminal RNA ribose 2'-O-methyltransferase Hen1 n=1 Tax=Nocardiopsis sp. MG754419 TaxID=2259865 RepID=UPI001BA911CA|nr:3' terminal RNA ribose 2'-O-methyltransferase Hen1 [Nocardiopsis sp. MG754419]MBR8740936.1 3' terminal RNA ribose 2'-O-methyltransferase Hen1 [Nocardiopsis sp. MG754419]
MLLTITTTARPATDLGYLLHKHPDKAQSYEQSFGTAHVFYPEATEERCTAALLLEVDPQALLRARTSVSTPDFSLAQYVNDRPYASSSLFTVALGRVLRTAIRGVCERRPELAATALPLELHLPAVPCRPGPDRARALFEPLGWTVRAEPVPLDPELPESGDAHYLSLTLTGTLRLSEALSHLYVLLPAMEGGDKHYWVDSTEIDKLLRAGGAPVDGVDGEDGAGWLVAHPEREWITRRYLARRERYVRTALSRLAEAEGQETERSEESGEGTAAPVPTDPAVEEREPSLAERRADAITSVLAAENVTSVVDLGCGGGKLLGRLVRDRTLERITGVDVHLGSLEIAHRRLCKGCDPGGGRGHRPLFVDDPGRTERPRVDLVLGSVVYRDQRFHGHDAAVLMEVVEHLDPSRLPAMEDVVFGEAAPRVVVVTTPNIEHNRHYEGLAEGALRHADHRFEWTRAEFTAWADRVAEKYGYTVRYLPVGTEHPEDGAPTQMGVFTR